MRFVCDSCRAQYMISDEKVGAKGVKVRCKKCGYVILVRRADAAPPAAKPAAQASDDGSETQVMENPLHGPSATLPENPEVTNPGNAPAELTQPKASAPAKGVFGGVNDDEIGAVFDQVLNSGQHKVPGDSGGNGAAKEAAKEKLGLGAEQDDHMSTRVIDADMVRKLAAESEDKEPQPVEEKASEKPKAEAAHDWFVAIDEKQTGPLTV